MLSMPSASLAEELGTSDRTLRRLVESGVVRPRWRARGHHPLPPAEVDWLRNHWQLVSGLRQALRSEPSVRAAFLFGSVAKGTDTPTSDIDLVVDVKSDDQMDLRGLRRRLGRKIGRPIDLFVLSDLEAEPERLLPIMSHARPVVDRAGAWRRLSQQRRVLQGRAVRRQRALKHRSL
jgi:predicted nucleotidyltransferase